MIKEAFVGFCSQKTTINGITCRILMVMLLWWFSGSGVMAQSISLKKAPAAARLSIDDPATQIDPTDFDALRLERLIEEEVNRIRRQKNKPELYNDGLLQEAAYIQAAYCAEQRKLTHSQRSKRYDTLGERVVTAGGTEDDYQLLGENLAFNGFTILTEGKRITLIAPTYEEIAKEMVAGWMDSKGHRENLLNKKFTHAGISVVYDDALKGIVGAQVFGKPILPNEP
ncbi:MAG: CAP domain-containing protein [Sphingobacteriales bacterium]|nr:CAP domain-containing protein [Sphingobacteriales bacterium]